MTKSTHFISGLKKIFHVKKHSVILLSVNMLLPPFLCVSGLILTVKNEALHNHLANASPHIVTVNCEKISSFLLNKSWTGWFLSALPESRTNEAR